MHDHHSQDFDPQPPGFVSTAWLGVMLLAAFAAVLVFLLVVSK